MWFAALGNYEQNPWLLRFMLRLLQGSPEATPAAGWNPFAQAPPDYVRALVYEYRFTSWPERKATGAWWKREYRGFYLAGTDERGFCEGGDGVGGQSMLWHTRPRVCSAVPELRSLGHGRHRRTRRCLQT